MRSSMDMPILNGPMPASPRKSRTYADPTMLALLDHIAEVLAYEYIHILKSSLPVKE